MRVLDSIIKKRNGGTLDYPELKQLIDGYVAASVPEYQVSAWLMAVYFQGMSERETSDLTRIMIDSGQVMDLSMLPGPFVDKHSTGGVGDKVSLILAPICAACGLQVPMMSGRSLGHTGGTLDKLESIPGYKTGLSAQDFARIIGECGFAMTGQSKQIVPADRLLYALRDATGTVESVPLITGSILSKKFAEGADALVFDVKTGPGAFMKTIEDARRLATSLVNTGRELGKKIVAVLSRMDEPLGTMVGNFLEVEESIEALQKSPKTWSAAKSSQADGPKNSGHSSTWRFEGPSGELMELTTRLAAWMLVAGGKAQTAEQGAELALQSLASGAALAKFEQNVRLQGGDLDEMYRRTGSWRAPIVREVRADRSGTVGPIDSFRLGMAGVYLGAGRSKTSDPVHPHVGIQVLKARGSFVREGEAVLRFWAVQEEDAKSAERELNASFVVESKQVDPAEPIILEEIHSL